jgi:hypothetical protein
MGLWYVQNISGRVVFGIILDVRRAADPTIIRSIFGDGLGKSPLVSYNGVLTICDHDGAACETFSTMYYYSAFPNVDMAGARTADGATPSPIHLAGFRLAQLQVKKNQATRFLMTRVVLRTRSAA